MVFTTKPTKQSVVGDDADRRYFLEPVLDIKGMGRPAFFSALIVVFAVCHTLFMRMNLPAYGPRIGTYLDDISYAALVALILYLIFNLPSLPRKIALLVFVLSIQLLMFGEWWNFEFYRDYIRYASLGHAADWK
ncbi:MAG: hypothetical protein U9Q71_09070, partial [Pseudomonadota bacterium]|nr:hypothetical protein [Pseudomonadota bacterium]